MLLFTVIQDTSLLFLATSPLAASDDDVEHDTQEVLQWSETETENQFETSMKHWTDSHTTAEKPSHFTSIHLSTSHIGPSSCWHILKKGGKDNCF